MGDLSNDEKFNILGWWKLGSRQDRSQCEPRELAIWHDRPPWGSICGDHGHLRRSHSHFHFLSSNYATQVSDLECWALEVEVNLCSNIFQTSLALVMPTTSENTGGVSVELMKERSVLSLIF